MSDVYGLQNSWTEGCCGVRQLHGFSDPEDAECGDFEGDYPELFKDMQGLEKGYVYQIWFYKQKRYDGSFEDEFVAEELRQLVMGIPNVRSLGSTTNPNSGNIIEGYQWIA